MLKAKRFAKKKPVRPFYYI